jgi:hypothetical protein
MAGLQASFAAPRMVYKNNYLVLPSLLWGLSTAYSFTPLNKILQNPK